MHVTWVVHADEQRGQMKCDSTRGEIPAGLKCIGLSGDSDCVCQSDSLGFFTRFPWPRAFARAFLTWLDYSWTYHQETRSRATCHAVWSGLFTEVKLRQTAEMKYSSLVLSCGARWIIRVVTYIQSADSSSFFVILCIVISGHYDQGFSSGNKTKNVYNSQLLWQWLLLHQ